MRLGRWLLLMVVCFSRLLSAQAANSPIKLSVDATEVARRILHVEMTVPASAGPLTLVYPEWIPGEHGPTGPIKDLSRLKFTANGVAVPWQRDSVDMYAFHLQMPAGATELKAQFDELGISGEGDFLLGNSATQQQFVLNWNQVVLYGQDSPSDRVSVQAQLKLPAAWKFGTALPVQSQIAQTISFKPVSLTTLVDSPVLAGIRFRDLDITPAGEVRAHRLDIAADSDAALEIPESVIASYRRLAAETGALFQARHYESYHFLVSLHGTFEDGLEHHESSDNRLPEMALADAQWRRMYAYLLAHEMTHSWNGKYRRPAGLATPDYQHPMKGELLWVYEGLTNYLGQVLAARSGLWTPEQYRDKIAQIAAVLDNRPGRTWRPLQDSATAAPIGYGNSTEWSAARRGGDSPDFYNEGSLLWLEVDTMIRAQSKGTKSLDDFCRAFYGGQSGPPAVVPFTFDDIVIGLNNIVAFDWRGYLIERLNSLVPHAPLGGIEAGGWRLSYSDQPSELDRALESQLGQVDMGYSIGALMDVNGKVLDVIPGTPAELAGLVPGMKVVALNMRGFSVARLREALREGKRSAAPVQLLVSDQDDFLNLRVNYHAGERYPQLTRDDSKPDVLGQILAPRSPER